METFLQEAKEASSIVATLSGTVKNQVLNDMATALIDNSERIEEENKKDIVAGKENNLDAALMDRLLLTKARISDMATAIREIAVLKEPVGRILEGWTTDTGLNIQKITVPIGVIGIIYESRPNVTSDTAALCLKSGNVCILKGGKEAQNSNKIIATVLQEALVKNNLPKAIVSLLPDASREGVAKLIKQDEYVDLIIPRGGHGLIKYISSNASVPVIKHDKGLCHTYIHKDADVNKALDVSINAKCRRVGICGAMETLLVDENIAPTILPQLKVAYANYETELRGCVKTQKYIEVTTATDEDYATEYLSNILSIKVVSNVAEAIAHIRTYGSDHSDAIITENYTDAEIFMNSIDSACVYLNASTQFTDGGQFGFGAEVGISTNKLHARGPMGIEGLTTYKFKIYGSGSTRA
ncbi:MAG: Gamma-glutamyl phosphate reductase (EC [uncultured Sulfurovum sp.]|uniref:Gamma-glutamyl phosphate reductase n=1 Tax=uncultured Sulfurovum sp. TaxID=269237 RepID=A0A6S6S329_9BACT|nr:MAG: Gamma-glutamyl phosphate reductase (EC [uncultured Sulfurovum sp.]